MQGFSQFITEGRDAPLYHATSTTGAIHIIGDNTLKLSHEYVKAAGEIPSISFTRSLKTAWHHAKVMHKKDNAVIFEVDQAKLAQKYKIEPYQFWSSPKRGSYSRVNKARVGRDDETEETYNEFEERILNSNVTDFDKYITKVIVYSSNSTALRSNSTYIRTHPKLYIYDTKTFPNK